MPTKTVINSQNQAALAYSAAYEFAGETTAALEPFLSSLLREEETLPDLELLQVLFGRWIERERADLIVADDQHAQELEKTREVREQRDITARRLYRKVLGARRVIEAIFGQGKGARIAGLRSGIPTEPVPLQRFARAAVNILSQPGFSLPEPEVAGASLDAAQTVADITPELTQLEDILQQLDPERRGDVKTLRAKNETLETHDQRVGALSRMLEALYELAGLKFYKERVRPSSRQRALPVTGDDTDSSTGDEGDQDGDDTGEDDFEVGDDLEDGDPDTSPDA